MPDAADQGINEFNLRPGRVSVKESPENQQPEIRPAFQPDFSPHDRIDDRHSAEGMALSLPISAAFLKPFQIAPAIRRRHVDRSHFAPEYRGVSPLLYVSVSVRERNAVGIVVIGGRHIGPNRGRRLQKKIAVVPPEIKIREAGSVVLVAQFVTAIFIVVSSRAVRAVGRAVRWSHGVVRVHTIHTAAAGVGIGLWMADEMIAMLRSLDKVFPETFTDYEVAREA